VKGEERKKNERRHLPSPPLRPDEKGSKRGKKKGKREKGGGEGSALSLPKLLSPN